MTGAKSKLSLLLGILLTLSLLFIARAESHPAENKMGQELRSFKFAEMLGVSSGKANVIYNKLLHHYSNMHSYSSLSEAIAYGVSQEEMKIDYPDSYGGAYLDTNTEKLVLCYTGDEDSFKKELLSFMNEDEMNSLLLKEVLYSYSDLNYVHEKILPVFCKQYPGLVANYMIRFTENRIILTVYSLDEEAISALCSMVERSIHKKADTLFTIQKENKSTFENLSSAPSGNAIYKHWALFSWGNYSIGFRAKKITASGTYYGFVTAAHDTQNNLNDNWKLSPDALSSVFGTTYSSAYNSTIDATFVKLNDNNVVTTSIANYSGTYIPSAFWFPQRIQPSIKAEVIRDMVLEL